MRRLLVASVLAGALALPVSSSATHAGCLATSAVPTCSYTAIGAHQAIPVVASSWEISVVRANVKVVLASGGGGPSDTGIHDVDALSLETVTVTINPDGPGGQAVGVITSGNTSGHLL